MPKKFMMGEYHPIEPIDKESAEKVFASGDINLICRTLVAVTFCETDWRWVQNTCLSFLDHQDPQASGLAATCLGHLARIHGKLDKAKVVSALKKHSGNKAIAGRIKDALDDISIFLKKEGGSKTT
jgi:hypothetical protein